MACSGLFPPPPRAPPASHSIPGPPLPGKPSPGPAWHGPTSPNAVSGPLPTWPCCLELASLSSSALRPSSSSSSLRPCVLILVEHPLRACRLGAAAPSTCLLFHTWGLSAYLWAPVGRSSEWKVSIQAKLHLHCFS